MRLVLLLALFCAPAWPALAGEIIGNTYISEKDGVIEISTDVWEIKDTEAPGSAQIAKLDLKRVPTAGFTATVLVFRIAHMGGAIKGEWMMGQLREGMSKQGAETGPLETKRIAGKRVLTMSYVISKDVGKANGLAYLLEGEKSLYWMMVSSNVTIWEHTRQAFEELMERVKY